MGQAARFALFGLLASLSLTATAPAQIVAELPIDLVPPEALTTAKGAAPDARFVSASIEVGDEQGRNTIEIAGADTSGRHIEVDLYQDGRAWLVEEVERLVTWEETPSAVRGAVESFYGRTWRPTLIERSENAEGDVVFEIEGVDRYADAIELIVTEAGALASLSKFNAR